MADEKRKSAAQLIIDYFREFRVLAENPREYWATQAITLLYALGYFSLLAVVVLFLSEDVGFSDTGAGYVVTLFTSGIAVCLLFSGPVGDWLGVRKAFFVAMAGEFVLHVAIAALALGPPFPGRRPLVALLFLLVAPFYALVQTNLQAANRRYTTRRTRGAGFNLWYLAVNIGAACGGFLVDFIRKVLVLRSSWIVAAGALASLLAMGATTLLRHERQERGDDEEEDPAKNEPLHKSPLQILGEIAREKTFWRLVVLITLLLGVRAVYVYAYILMPKYWVRTIGPGAPIGTFNAINPILIVVGLVLFIPLANKFNIFKMLVYGSMVSALSLFALVVPWRLVSGDFVRAYYILSFVAMVLLALGETLWSPKLYEYAAAIAPRGQEGTYLGMALLPFFVAKTVVGALSGHLLARFIPEGIGEGLRAGTVPFWHSPAALWLLLGLWAMSGPIVALFVRGWLTDGARWKNEVPPGPAAKSA